MEIKDKNGLLKQKTVDEQISELLEELDVNATEDKKAEEACPIETAKEVEAKAEEESVPAEEVAEVVVKEELETPATEDKPAEEVTPELKNEDVYCDVMEPEKGEDVGEVVVKEELETPATEEKEPEEVEAEKVADEVEAKAEEESVPAEDVAEVVVKEEEEKVSEEAKDVEAEDPNVAAAKEENDGEEELEPAESKLPEDEEEIEEDIHESALFKLIRSINESIEAQNANGPYGEAGELENVATDEKPAEELAPEVSTEEVYEDEKAAEDVAEVVVKEELETPATEEKEPEEVEAEKVADEVEAKAEEESVPAEDVGEAVIKEGVTAERLVTIVIEAAKQCKANGIPASIVNICEAAESELAPLMGNGKEFADKEYDVDAAVESSEMNGSESEFEKYEDIQGEGADAALTGATPAEVVHESVKYTSLKEACMLDEGYFETDSYVKETSDEKSKKLTEQIALLMAREAMDPAYDELLRESMYCTRLQESIKSKYMTEACKKAERILLANKKK